MGIVTILPETTKNPITLMGQRAGICWNANVSDNEKNYKRGLDCIKSGHGRVMEYVNVEMIIDGYSAKVLREYYTHIGGSPTRLQASTRYIDYSKGDGFNYVTPNSIKNNYKVNKDWEKIKNEIIEKNKYIDEIYEHQMLLWKEEKNNLKMNNKNIIMV